jgi:cytochrome c5
VSKQDSHFFNTFSIVIAILVAITILLFALARAVGASTQVEHLKDDPEFIAAVGENLKPLAQVAVAGQDNSALQIVASNAASGSALPAANLPSDGLGAYEKACKTCHASGLAGAPKSGDKGAWAPRIAQGKDTLYKHAIEGFAGKAGVMPAKGGFSNYPDDLVKLAVDHMVEINQ